MSLDLFDNMSVLAMMGGKAAIPVLARSVVESYARGFWIACIADVNELERFMVSKKAASTRLIP